VYKTFSDQNFDEEVLKAKKPVLVDFWAPWCGPCQITGPMVETIAQEIGNKAIVGKLNVDENPIIAQKYGVMSIPTLIIFKGGIIVDQVVGAQPKEILKQKLESFTNERAN